jgi:uridine phosphorylase
VQNREFVTHTGICNGKRITALATGIGTDNIDIVINELDALVNIDLEKRIPKETHTELRIVRLGTSGALQADIDIETFIASRYGLGFDGLLNYYKSEGNAAFDIPMADAFIKEAKWMPTLGKPYVVKGSDTLFTLLSEGLKSGITATSPGFYGPQGRILRLKTADPDLNEKIEAFRYKDLRITNFEMETSALYGLSALLGHQACTLCTIIANRVAKKFSKDYHPAVERMIEWTLERLTR